MVSVSQGPKTNYFHDVPVPNFKGLDGKHETLRLRGQSQVERIRVYTPIVQGEHSYEDSRMVQKQLTRQEWFDAEVRRGGKPVGERPIVPVEPEIDQKQFEPLVAAALLAAKVLDAELSASNEAAHARREIGFMSGRRNELAILDGGPILNLTFFISGGRVAEVHVFPSTVGQTKVA